MRIFTNILATVIILYSFQVSASEKEKSFISVENRLWENGMEAEVQKYGRVDLPNEEILKESYKTLAPPPEELIIAMFLYEYGKK